MFRKCLSKDGHLGRSAATRYPSEHGQRSLYPKVVCLSPRFAS